MIRWLIRRLFPTACRRERRLRGWARLYNFELLRVGADSYALASGIVRHPSAGGCPLDEIENYLHGCKYGLLRSWKR
jgi:hypothetical protein